MSTGTARQTRPRHDTRRSRPHARSNHAVKRATYTVDSRARVLTIAADGATKLIDTPAELYEIAAAGVATADTYIIEPHLDDDATAELEAIITDYLKLAVLSARVPMTFSRLGDFLEALAE